MPFSYAKDGFGKRQRLWISSCFFAVMEAFSYMLETVVVAEDLVGRQFLDSMCLVSSFVDDTFLLSSTKGVEWRFRGLLYCLQGSFWRCQFIEECS